MSSSLRLRQHKSRRRECGKAYRGMISFLFDLDRLLGTNCNFSFHSIWCFAVFVVLVPLTLLHSGIADTGI